MSKKRRAFRPAVSDILETRTVPSGFGGYAFGNPFMGGFGAPQENRGGGYPDGTNPNVNGTGMIEGAFGGQGGVQTVVSKDAQAVVQALGTFQQSYQKDVQTILYGSGTPASNRSAFDAQVGTDLTTLNTSIDAAIANITGTANPTLASSIQTDLLGTGSTSLQAELAAIPTPSSTHSWSSMIFRWESTVDIFQSGQAVSQLVSNATVPDGTITQATFNTLKTSIDSAYQTFRQGYVNTMQTSATDPSANRAAFDTAVQGLVSTLGTSIGAAVTAANLPSSVATTVTTSITTDLTGTPTNGTSLQAGLAALTSPSSSSGFAGWLFLGRSQRAINGSDHALTSDILTAINNYNTSLTE